MRSMTAIDQRVTYAEMLEWPDDGRRYELYDGEVIVVPAPVLRHQRVAFHVMDVLRKYDREICLQCGAAYELASLRRQTPSWRHRR